MKFCKDCEHADMIDKPPDEWRCQKEPRISYQTGKPLKNGWCDVKNDDGECKDHELNA